MNTNPWSKWELHIEIKMMWIYRFMNNQWVIGQCDCYFFLFSVFFGVSFCMADQTNTYRDRKVGFLLVEWRISIQLIHRYTASVISLYPGAGMHELYERRENRFERQTAITHSPSWYCLFGSNVAWILIHVTAHTMFI